MKLFADLTEATKAIDELQSEFNHAQLSKAVRLAINDTMRRERTQLRRGVRKEYNLPADKIKSIEFRPATDLTLTAKMGASGKPVQLAYFKPVFAGFGGSVSFAYAKGGFSGKKTKAKKGASGVSVEIKKGDRVTLPSAFMVSKFETPLVFARGKYQKGKGFIWGKPRNPINVLNTASVFGAAFGQKKLPAVSREARAALAVKAVEYLEKLKSGVIK